MAVMLYYVYFQSGGSWALKVPDVPYGGTGRAELENLKPIYRVYTNNNSTNRLLDHILPSILTA